MHDHILRYNIGGKFLRHENFTKAKKLDFHVYSFKETTSDIHKIIL